MRHDQLYFSEPRKRALSAPAIKKRLFGAIRALDDDDRICINGIYFLAEDLRCLLTKIPD